MLKKEKKKNGSGKSQIVARLVFRIARVAVLKSLGRSPTVQCILKRADDGSHQAKMLSLSLHLQMHIFKQQLQQFSDARCITSEKNTV